MDNITHGLAAMVLAECVVARRRAVGAEPPPRVPLFVASILGNNLPDADFVYRGITPGRLGYLLHHRGHTHTCVGAALIGVALCAAVLAVMRLRKQRPVRRDLIALGVVSLLGPFVHIAMDFQNSYGVHPFWPFDDRWYYGDTIFIVEPLFWAAALPPLALLARTVVARAVLSLLLVGMLVAAVLNHTVTPLALGLVVAVAGASGLAAWRSRIDRRVVAAVAGWAVVLAAFVAGGFAARREGRGSLAALFPTTHVVDLIRSPLPANPGCWSTIAVGTDGDRYVVRRATIAALPWPWARCPDVDPTNSGRDLAPPETGDTSWRTLFEAPISGLRRLVETRCDVRAFLRFSRAPWWSKDDGAAVGDLRFARNRSTSFAELAVGDARGSCPPWVPPWTPPRADVLGHEPFP